MNWLRPAKRLAIYLRDGLACAYCGQAVEDGAQLTLDHLRPHSAGGSNAAMNLVTACHVCNSSRGRRGWKFFAGRVAAYRDHGVTAQAIIAHIDTTRRRRLDLAAAKELIAHRGGFSVAAKGELV